MQNNLNLSQKLKSDFSMLMDFVSLHPSVALAGQAKRQGLHQLALEFLESVSCDLEKIASMTYKFTGFSALSLSVMASKKIDSLL